MKTKETDLKVVVIGQGNVGTQMARIFGTEAVSSRTLEDIPTDSDLYIISVSDNAVASVAASLPKVKGIVVHTTGSVPMEVLSDVKCSGYGVLYPFQTISKARPLEADKIPLMIEADDLETLHKINVIARSFGFTDISEADSEIRRRTHLAGTFVCNFTNALVGIGQQIFEQCGIDPKIGNPLLAETVEKLRNIPAKEAQTGPAARHDTSTLEKHRMLLEELGMNEEKRIYDLLSGFIMNQKK